MLSPLPLRVLVQMQLLFHFTGARFYFIKRALAGATELALHVRYVRIKRG
jgi:hypothetical protein